MNYRENLQRAVRENNNLALELLNAKNIRNAVFMVAYEHARYVDGINVYDDSGKRDDKAIYESFAKIACIKPQVLEDLCSLGQMSNMTKADFACLCFYGLGIPLESSLVQTWTYRFEWFDVTQRSIKQCGNKGASFNCINS